MRPTNEHRTPDRGGKVSRSVTGSAPRKRDWNTPRRKAPGASCTESIVDAIGLGRGSAGLSGFGRRVSLVGRQRWDRLLVPRKKTPWPRWRRSEGSHDRQPAKDRAASADAPSAHHDACRSPTEVRPCAVKRTPTCAIACLNRTRRQESIDSLVLVVNRRLSEFGKDASFPLPKVERPESERG